MAAGWPAADPGVISGTVTPQTVTAVASVVANLSGKLISSSVKTAIQMATAAASFSTTAMSVAQSAIAQYAAYLIPAVFALTAKYTRATAPPAVPPPRVQPQQLTTFARLWSPSPGTTSTKALPAGSIQARTPAGLYRVAVPSATAAGLGGPSASLGAAPFFEVASRSTAAPGAILVSEKDFDKKTGDVPFWKKPTYWAIVGGVVVVVGGGAYWALKG